MRNLLNASPDERPLSFWHFAGPVLLGSIAGGLARMGTKAALADARPETQTLGATATGISAFWLVAGLTYVALNRRAT